jgi:aldehyde dehydrogenase (NAD+)
MVTYTQQSDLATDVVSVFEAQSAFAPSLVHTQASERIAKLKKLLDYTNQNLDKIQAALYADFKRHPSETILGEVLGVTGEIKHLIKSLKGWMKPQKVPTPMGMLGTSAYVRFEPKGVCLIISPWNYPFNLAIKPLAQAIAAGNTAILKPSELTPNTSQLIKEMLAELFDEQEVAVFTGDASTSQALLKLPFNHVFFTGSPQVGKVVMKAAAEHLASVTLELGGKSPCVVDETADIKKTAAKIAWGKFLNNGQTCIAPDYLLVHQSVKDQLVSEIKSASEKMYNATGSGIENSDSYCRIVNQRHFQRVKGLIEDALQKGATLSYGGQTNDADNYVSPTLLDNLSPDMRIMQEEIFGPVLPVISYQNPQEVIGLVNGKEKPLALYINSKKDSNIKYFLENTTAGGTVINDSIIHYGHTELPFGGVNNSGIGKSGGLWGFTEFSNQRAVLRQRFGDFSMVYPPYTDKVQKMIKLLMRFL